MIISLITGLLLFITSTMLLKKWLALSYLNQIKERLARLNHQIWSLFLVGILGAFLLHSSSAFIALVIVLVSLKTLTIRSGFVLSLGANVGTTLTALLTILNSQIIILGLTLAALVLLIKKQIKGAIIMVLVILILTSLDLIADSLARLAQAPALTALVSSCGALPLLGVAIGALAVGIIQSSTAFVLLIQQVSYSTTFSLLAITSLIIGANIGTCLDTFLVAHDRRGRQVAFYNCYFNIISAASALLVIGPFTALVAIISNNQMARAIFWAHFLFNLLGALIAMLIIQGRIWYQEIKVVIRENLS